MNEKGDNKEHFDKLLRPHVDRLYRLAYRLTGAVSDAEDLVQDVLIKAYERVDELSSIEALAPWLGRVLYNRFVDDSRRYARNRFRTVSVDEQHSHAPTGLELADAGAGPEAGAQQALDIMALQKGLAQLSIDHRTVLLLHDSEGYKLEEIQLITGTPVGTLKSRLHRARARLRALVTGDGTF